MKRHKPKHHAPISAAEQAQRIHRAMQEQRFPQALELARALYKSEPTPEHLHLLQNAALDRARQLRGQNYTRDAIAVLDAVIPLGGSPEWLAKVAEELARLGAQQRAASLVAGITDPQVLARLNNHAVDAALSQGKAGRDKLAENLRDGFDLIVRAFVEVEAGQDEQARATLQGIGLQSPYLEWKLLLRGLLAYYQNDDARAVENWQRLDPERFPYRMVAPLRLGIDNGFRQSQPPATQHRLLAQADALMPSNVSHGLRQLQKQLANPDEMVNAFRQAETVVPLLRKDHPHLVPRLAACFFWAIVLHGAPPDMGRYKRVFGAPADDKEMARLEALALEHRGDLEGAHHFWQRFEKSIAANPAAWPGESAPRARALVWLHLGRLALLAEAEPEEDFGDFFAPPKRHNKLKPGVEECFKKAVELAPDQLEMHTALVQCLVAKKPAQAEAAARKLLERFPTHAPTLETVGDRLLDKKNYNEALEFYQRALQANPLEKKLRSKVSLAHSLRGEQAVLAGALEEARAAFATALQLSQGTPQVPLLSKWATAEFKAGDADKGAELLKRAQAQVSDPRSLAYPMVAESIRMRLPKALKKTFEDGYKGLLAEKSVPAVAAAWIEMAAAYQNGGDLYLGAKTHQKQITGYLDKAVKLDFTEDQLIQVTEALRTVGGVRLREKFVEKGQKAFRASPYFWLALAEIQLARQTTMYNVDKALKKAAPLLAAMPAGERKDKWQRWHDDLQKRYLELNPWAGLLGGFRGGMPSFLDPFGKFAGDDDDDDYDDDDGW